MNKKIYACYASSDFFCPHTGISILSLFENNKNLIEKLFVLDYGILDENKAKLNKLSADYNVPLEYIDAGAVLYGIKDRLNISSFRGSLATYSRAFIDFIMPDYVDRLLYIDSDTVVNGSVKELIDVDMTGKVIAGIADIDRYGKKVPDGEFPLLTGNKLYIGCGIVLYSVSNWRAFKCSDMIAEVCRKNIPFRFADQTLINNAIPEKYMRKLPLKYNFIAHIYHPNWVKRMLRGGSWYTEAELDEAVNSPVVIHYAGSPLYRPWYDGCKSRRREEYLKYKAMSPWSDVPLLSLEEHYNSLTDEQKIDFKYRRARIALPSYNMVRAASKFRNVLFSAGRM